MPGKMARSGPRPPFGLREVTVAVRTSRLYCRKARKAQIFMQVWESSGEYRIISISPTLAEVRDSFLRLTPPIWANVEAAS